MPPITFVPDEVLDKVLDDIIANGDLIHLTGDLLVTSTYANVVAASIGSYAPTITKSDEGSGRKATVEAKSGVVIDTTTNFAGVDKEFSQQVIVDTVNLKIKHIGQGTPKTLSDTDTINAPAYDIDNPAILSV